MKISDAFPSTYLKAADLNGRTVRAVIDYVRSEDIGGDHKPVMYFKGKEKGLVLNKTNASTLAYGLGDDESDNWSGATIELFSMMVSFQGQMKPGIRVRIPEDAPKSTANVAPNARARAQYDERNPPPADPSDDVPF